MHFLLSFYSIVLLVTPNHCYASPQQPQWRSPSNLERQKSRGSSQNSVWRDLLAVEDFPRAATLDRRHGRFDTRSFPGYSSDGRCGPKNGGLVCDPNSEKYIGTCCSYEGWCGSEAEYCATGCTSGCFNTANSPRTHPGRCGPDFGGTQCDSDGPFGGCCSRQGWCGSTKQYCELSNGCMSGCASNSPVAASESQNSKTNTSSNGSPIPTSAYSTQVSSSVIKSLSHYTSASTSSPNSSKHSSKDSSKHTSKLSPSQSNHTSALAPISGSSKASREWFSTVSIRATSTGFPESSSKHSSKHPPKASKTHSKYTPAFNLSSSPPKNNSPKQSSAFSSLQVASPSINESTNTGTGSSPSGSLRGFSRFALSSRPTGLTLSHKPSGSFEMRKQPKSSNLTQILSHSLNAPLNPSSFGNRPLSSLYMTVISTSSVTGSWSSLSRYTPSSIPALPSALFPNATASSLSITRLSSRSSVLVPKPSSGFTNLASNELNSTLTHASSPSSTRISAGTSIVRITGGAIYLTHRSMGISLPSTLTVTPSFSQPSISSLSSSATLPPALASSPPVPSTTVQSLPIGLQDPSSMSPTAALAAATFTPTNAAQAACMQPFQNSPNGNVGAGLTVECFVALEIPAYLQTWIATKYITECPNIPDFSTCFQEHLGIYDAGTDCTGIEENSCTGFHYSNYKYLDWDVRDVYILQSIYGINQYFSSWYHGLLGAQAGAALTIGTIVNRINPPKTENVLATDILAILGLGLALLDPPAGIAFIGLGTLADAISATPTFLRALLPEHVTTSTQVQIYDIQSQLATLVAQFLTQISNATAHVEANATAFLAFASTGLFIASPVILDTVVSQTYTYLNTFILGQALTANNIVATVGLDTNVQQLASNSSASALSYDINCPSYDNNSMCNGWYYDPATSASFALDALTSMSRSFHSDLSFIFSNGWTNGSLLFTGALQCARSGAAGQGPQLVLGSPSKSFAPACYSTLKICTWDLGCALDSQCEFSDCPLQSGFGTNGCGGNGDGIYDFNVPYNYLGTFLTDANPLSTVCNDGP